MSATATETLHAPVMVDEVLAELMTTTDGWYVDGTAGTGGHAAAILGQLSARGRLLGLDLDPKALEIARRRLAPSAERVVLRQASYEQLPAILAELQVNQCQGLLLDLGMSSFSLEGSGRGFSFRVDEPLDMRYDPGRGHPLAQVLPALSFNELADILARYGEEHQAGRIAGAIHRDASAGLLTTSGALAATVRAASTARQVTKTLARVFQALRIHINDELHALGSTLDRLGESLSTGARLVVISYHSLEDRLVKQFIARESKDCICPPELPACVCDHKATFRPITRKPLTPSPVELARNSRSRSAKLRAAERV